jgi:hypothetical protein
MAGMLLEEGQARTYASSPTHTSTQGNTLNGHTRSAELMNIEQSPAQKTSPKQKRNVPTMQKEGADNNPGKKRMGLAILFLGILAKES